jgi:murein DD-endopeptidase MepM/ murein hydrolase activator NlpD
LDIEVIHLQKQEKCISEWTLPPKEELQFMPQGNGVVKRADSRSSGFGKHIRIDHGFGYISLYAHLSKYNVRRGQKVKRGDIIGYVGNTGRSAGPHLHYEIIKDNKKINPLNFYYGNLSPEEFEALLTQSKQENQSLD